MYFVSCWREGQSCLDIHLMKTAICTTSLESHFCHTESKRRIPAIPGIFRVPAFTGSVTEMAKQMAFGLAMPVFGIFWAITFSCRLQNQILADDPFSSFCKLLGVIVFQAVIHLGYEFGQGMHCLLFFLSLPPRHGQVLLQ